MASSTPKTGTVDPILLDRLQCPRDGERLRAVGLDLECGGGHRYPVVNGIPVLVLREAPKSLEIYEDAFDPEVIARYRCGDPTEYEGGVHPYVQERIVGPCGFLYAPIAGRLPDYPIPEISLPDPAEASSPSPLFVEVGCNWGRWCFAAARSGYDVIGVDAQIHAVVVAQRIAHQLGLSEHIQFVVADVRFLPLRSGTADFVFSYSVLQHMAKREARATLRQIHRILREGGTARIQLPNPRGVRSAFNRLRYAIRRERSPYRVRYWTPRELVDSFESAIGPSFVSVDGFFSLNAQASDLWMLPRRYRVIVRASLWLKRLSRRFNGLVRWADSLFVESRKPLRPGSG